MRGKLWKLCRKIVLRELYIFNILNIFRWHWVYRNSVPARAAHSAIYINETDTLYVFGGYNLNSALGNMVIFRFNHSQWEDEDGELISKFDKNSSAT